MVKGESLNKEAGLQQSAPQLGKECQTPGQGLHDWVWMGQFEFCCFTIKCS